jgi:cytochrome c556
MLRFAETCWADIAEFGASHEEMEALLDAIHANCPGDVDCCDRDESITEPYCASHDMLYSMNSLAGLLGMRRSRATLIAQELSV